MGNTTQTQPISPRYGWRAVLLLMGLCCGIASAGAWYRPVPGPQGMSPYPPAYGGRPAIYPYHGGGQVFPHWYLRAGIDRFGRYRFEFRVRGNARQFQNLWLWYQSGRHGY